MLKTEFYTNNLFWDWKSSNTVTTTDINIQTSEFEESKKKSEIIQRLLDSKLITVEEAMVLIKETVIYFDKSNFIKYQEPPIPYFEQPLRTGVPSWWFDNCPCNTKNGGSGVCDCSLGYYSTTCKKD